MLLDCAAADYWRSLYLATLGALVVFRVLAEGPFGVFTADAGRRPNALLIAGGIGITPIRALMEDMQRSAVVIYRVLREEDIVLGGELDAMAREHALRLHYVVGDHRTAEGREHLSPAHLRELVPDIAERDVYVCGPPGLTDVLERNVRAAGVPKPFIHAERLPSEHRPRLRGDGHERRIRAVAAGGDPEGEAGMSAVVRRNEFARGTSGFPQTPSPVR